MLEAIGLSPVESRLYTTLIDNPRSTAPELARYCEIPSGQAARGLAHLARRGLASRLPGEHACYIAVAPDISIQLLLSRREHELHQVRAAIQELTVAFHRASRHTHPAELVEVVTGSQNIMSRAFQLQDSAQASMRAIDMPPYVMPMGANVERERRRLSERIDYRVLYDREAVAQPGRLSDIQRLRERGEKARVLAGLPLKLWIADDTAALIPIRGSNHENDAAFIVYPSALLDGLIALFELEWERAVPMRLLSTARAEAHDAQGPSTPDPDEITGALLSLLAAGLTDEGIARSLGLSLRTVQRRIHDLMRELNATTRFQAGMAARERGWV